MTNISLMHEYHCRHCGYTSNDDRIGAMNIQLLGTNWVTNKETAFNQLQFNQE
ncbi:IS607 family transposase ISLasa12 [Lactobacillus helveticus CIRM-BIA 953]|uniref:IS607 family transposase ISLasa12 n=1 Tax=Lactobacillus helveticus CIRM-BIA 953 TaxID=1226335 RepID=U4QLT1_LACHE|nr:transposase [Lactobacillus helveticus]CDI41805.1 IS607 family transposase ISLasa12 [Lactobacillus helveticus CIRM-BIA 953]